MTEIWKSLKGLVECGDNYEVSNLGNVRSIDKLDSRNRKRKGQYIKIWMDKDVYQRVTLNQNKKKKNYGVHRLVALAFIENPENKETVNHNDGNKSNNKIDNLEWATRKEQINHADENNLRKMPKGENWYNATLTESQVIEIFNLYKERKYTLRKLAEKYNTGLGAIQGVVYGRSWKHLNLLNK